MAGNLVKILDGNTFVVCDERGDIQASPTDPTGLFSFDMRFLSHWVLTINGQTLNPLSIDDLQYFESRFFLVPGTGTVYIDAKLSVSSTRRGTRVPRGDAMVNGRPGRPGRPDGRRLRLRRCVRDRGRPQTRHIRDEGGGRAPAPPLQREVRPPDPHLESAPAKIDDKGLTPSRTVATCQLDKSEVVTSQAAAADDAMYDRPSAGRGRRGGPPEHGTTSALDRRRPGSVCRTPEVDLPTQPCRPGRPPLLAAHRRGGACRLPACVVHDDVRSRQHLHEPPVARGRGKGGSGDWQGSHRRLQGRGPRSGPPRDARGRMAALGQPHSPHYSSADATPLYTRAPRQYETGTATGTAAIRNSGSVSPRWIDITPPMGNGTSRTSVVTNSQDSRTRPGRLVELDLGTAMAGCRTSGGDRATGVRVRRQGPRCPARAARLEGRGVRAAPGATGSRAQASLRPRLLAPGPRLLRPRPGRRREPGRCARVEYRSPPVEWHRRRIQSVGDRRSPHGATAVLGLGCPDAR